MFKLISPASKVLALALSVGLTWSTLGSITEGIQSDAVPTATVAQLPLVVVIGHRDPSVPLAQPTESAQAQATEDKLSVLNHTRKNAAI